MASVVTTPKPSEYLVAYRMYLTERTVPPPSESQQRVFRIYELLLEIFSYCDKKTISGCAVVCKEWSEPALDVLWKSLEHPSSLVHVLKFAGGEEFFSPPNAKAWTRFHFYAKRVRQLRFQYGARGYKSWDLNTFTNAFLTRPSSVVLPSLRQLEWDAPDSQWVSASLVFIHPGLQSLRLTLPMHSSPQIAHFISLLFGRVPHLTELQLTHKSKIDPREIEAPMIQLLETTRALRRIVIPRTFLTTGVMVALSCLPQLIELTGSFPGSSTTEFSIDAGGVMGRAIDKPFPSVPGGFPKLVKFQSAVSMSNFSDWLQHPDMPRRLKLLSNHDINHMGFTAQDASQMEIENIARIIHVDYVYLEVLDLKLPSHNNTFASIRPLLILEQLKDLRVSCDAFVEIWDHNMHELAQALPFLKRLSFPRTTEIYVPERKPRLTLAAVDVIVTHCRNIRQIELFLDAKKVPSFIPTTSPTLNSLILGSSLFNPTDAVELALWFSHLSDTRAIQVRRDTMSIDKPWGILYEIGMRLPESYGTGVLEMLPTLTWNDIGKMCGGMLKSRLRGREEAQRRSPSPSTSSASSSSSKGKGKDKEVTPPTRSSTRINCGCDPDFLSDFESRRRQMSGVRPEGTASPCLLTVDLPKPNPYGGEVYYHPSPLMAASPPPLPHHIVHGFMAHPVL
ncbi:hypothetical protein FRC02_005960, partial [Tulasnella sp. 418]